MSRKTQNIYKSIQNLENIQRVIENYAKTQNEKVLSDSSFQMSQELKNLKFWIESLYLYNGKSTSNAKKASSRENGKKGGRPPKIVTEMRRRKIQIEDELIPELESKKRGTIDFLEEQILQEKILTLQQEADELFAKLSK